VLIFTAFKSAKIASRSALPSVEFKDEDLPASEAPEIDIPQEIAPEDLPASFIFFHFNQEKNDLHQVHNNKMTK
jgi:hypothetical protein